MMRVFTSDVKVIDRTRVCVLLVLVFICSIDRSSSVDTTAKTTISFRHPSSLNEVQLRTAVTIEFNFTGIDKTNRTALDAIYREVRRKILDYLNRKKSSTASPTTTIVAATTAATTSATPPPPPTTIVLHSTTVTTPTITTTAALPTTITTSVVEATTNTPTNAATTTIATSVVEATTDIFTNAATTTVTIQSITTPPKPSPAKKRRRSSGGNNGNFTEDELSFVFNDPEFDEYGNLIISIILDKEGVDDELLYKAVEALQESGELEAAANATVKNYYRGLPPVKAAMAGFQVWLPILLAIILLLIIFILVFCCWMAKKKKKVKDDDRKKIIPPLDSKPSSSNGQAPKPRILDDNDGRIVPMDQFSEEF